MFKQQTCCSWDEVFLPLNTKKTFQNIPLFRHNILIPSGTRKQVMTTQEKGLNTSEDKSNRVLFFKAMKSSYLVGPILDLKFLSNLF